MAEDFEGVYLEYSDKIYGFIFLLVRHRETAEDLTQETFYKAFKKQKLFKNQSSFLTWLLKIARNATYDHLRRRRIIRFISLGNEDGFAHSSLSTESTVETQEELTQLYSALARLKKDYRDVIILRRINGCSIKETAYILGWTEAKVKAKLSRGADALRKEFYGKGGVINGAVKRI